MLRFEYPSNTSSLQGIFGSRKVNAERMFEHLKPAILDAVKALGTALMKDDGLDPILRELVIIRVGYLSQCEYEVYQHASFARSLGVSEEKIAAISTTSPVGLDESEKLVIDFVDEVVQKVRPSDTALSAVRGHFSDSQVLQIVTVVGNWMLAARVLETTGVELDEVAIGDHGVPENFLDSSVRPSSIFGDG